MVNIIHFQIPRAAMKLHKVENKLNPEVKLVRLAVELYCILHTATRNAYKNESPINMCFKTLLTRLE